jgi:hypothetical protein
VPSNHNILIFGGTLFIGILSTAETMCHRTNMNGNSEEVAPLYDVIHRGGEDKKKKKNTNSSS